AQQRAPLDRDHPLGIAQIIVGPEPVDLAEHHPRGHPAATLQTALELAYQVALGSIELGLINGLGDDPLELALDRRPGGGELVLAGGGVEDHVPAVEVLAGAGTDLIDQALTLAQHLEQATGLAAEHRA